MNSRKVEMKQNVMGDKYEQARKNRAWFDDHGIFTINIMGSPGCGKTTLLEMTAGRINEKMTVIEGDLQTDRDTQRMLDIGVDAYQITTGQGCHLDAFLVEKALINMKLNKPGILFIENVGNLVCPASHDLGAHLNVVVLSVPEGDDKVAKYPVMFQKADVLLLTKVDLLPVIKYNMQRVIDDFALVNPRSEIISMALPDTGIQAWVDYISNKKGDQKYVSGNSR